MVIFEKNAKGMRPIKKDVPTDGIEPGRTMAAGAILVNLIGYLVERYRSKYAILPSIDVSFPEQDFTCDLGIFPPRKVDWMNDMIRVEPPISAFEIVMPTETTDSLIDAIRRHYFTNGVKSAWMISPNQKSVSLLYPDRPAQVFTDGLIRDSTSGLDLDVAELFA